jgi:tetrahydromethanopterin S-methyltransferase subunit B
MRTQVPTIFSNNSGAHNSHKPASSDDWPYCAFNEQLQRIAGQLAATIEGIDVGTLVCTMFHIILQVSSTVIST